MKVRSAAGETVTDFASATSDTPHPRFGNNSAVITTPVS
ncbi:hypothetical protein SNARM312S_06960 [Streptomyces narbonensis]